MTFATNRASGIVSHIKRVGGGIYTLRVFILIILCEKKTVESRDLMSDIPIEELEEMVEWFRETAEGYEDKMSRYEKDKYRAAYRGKASGFTSAANRLNAKIDHHKDD